MWKSLIKIHKLKYRSQQELRFEDVTFTPIHTPSSTTSSTPMTPDAISSNASNISNFVLPLSLLEIEDTEMKNIIRNIISAIKEKVIPWTMSKHLEQFKLEIGNNTYDGVLTRELREVVDDESYRVSLTNPLLREQNHRDYYIYLKYNGESIIKEELSLEENIEIVSNFFEKYALKTKLGYVWFKKVETVSKDNIEDKKLGADISKLIEEGIVKHDGIDILISDENKKLLQMEYFTSDHHYIKVNGDTYVLY